LRRNKLCRALPVVTLCAIAGAASHRRLDCKQNLSFAHPLIAVIAL